MCALKSKCMSEMNFPAIWRPKFQSFSARYPADCANGTKTQSLGKNGSREKCSDKSLVGII